MGGIPLCTLSLISSNGKPEDAHGLRLPAFSFKSSYFNTY